MDQIEVPVKSVVMVNFRSQNPDLPRQHDPLDHDAGVVQVLTDDEHESPMDSQSIASPKYAKVPDQNFGQLFGSMLDRCHGGSQR